MLYRQPFADLVSITSYVTRVRQVPDAHTADEIAHVTHDQTSFHSACSLSSRQLLSDLPSAKGQLIVLVALVVLYK